MGEQGAGSGGRVIVTVQGEREAMLMLSSMASLEDLALVLEREAIDVVLLQADPGGMGVADRRRIAEIFRQHSAAIAAEVPPHDAGYVLALADALSTSADTLCKNAGSP